MARTVDANPGGRSRTSAPPPGLSRLVFRQRRAAPIFSGAAKTSPGRLFHLWPAHGKRFVSIVSRLAGTSSPAVAAEPVEVVARVEPPASAEAPASAVARAWAVARLVRSAAWRPASLVTAEAAVVASRALRQVWQAAA